MSFRRALSLACGVAGGSAVLVCAAVAADKHGYFADGCRLRDALAAVRAAQPPAWPAANGWDYNWDKRDPSSPVNGKRKESVGENGSPDADNSKPKATRHIFLIRHSQYNLKGDGDKERILTALGREQAEYTGQRLAALGLKYDVLIHSSMTRATETASIISKYLPGVELVSCDLLREGAPIEPVPPVTHWKPEAAGPAVSSGGLAEDGPEQRQHHLADGSTQRPRGSPSAGRLGLHASR
ncbi:serine/threonine-protein phosphatase PGAM5, mitochondrial isoform X5 [Puntigrus tetrazona]|uniref:serine/threonine-protein phosphatase PGAM5, mitochondrial isoform X5 n=1 Tax=Puntigrus tetrazona TaxID=1606681 RepID=UPI001C89269B|nr:serine/threonine-protein phosphatase PGAM5, mitochondrial isoform X5 [Puntigrus tetrazona]